MPLRREGYARQGDQLLKQMEEYGAEQSGFAIFEPGKLPHCEMSGGEFCGNAARAMAVLLSIVTQKSKTFTISGFNGKVEASVTRVTDSRYKATCFFPRMILNVESVLVDSVFMDVVDLGGIVHVVLRGELPKDYQLQHQNIVKALGLGGRDAVGVIWLTEKYGKVFISPVVWVRAINSFFLEGSCGSGSIAAAKVLGKEISRIGQRTGECIEVKISSKGVSLMSEMSVVYGGSSAIFKKSL